MDGISWRHPAFGHWPSSAEGQGAAGRGDDVSTLAAQLTILDRLMRSPMHDTLVDTLIDSAEQLTADLAATCAHGVDGIYDKARVLHDRLQESLDIAVPAEAVTLALASSLLRDLAHLARTE